MTSSLIIFFNNYIYHLTWTVYEPNKVDYRKLLYHAETTMFSSYTSVDAPIIKCQEANTDSNKRIINSNHSKPLHELHIQI